VSAGRGGRGSLEIGDMLGNLTAAPMETTLLGRQGRVHEGMLSAATYVHCNTGGALEDAARRFPGWPLLITGHSMGGARPGPPRTQERWTREWLASLRDSVSVLSVPVSEAWTPQRRFVIFGLKNFYAVESGQVAWPAPSCAAGAPSGGRAAREAA